MEADAGTTVARARSGATGLVRTAGRTNLARAPGGTRLVRITPRATPVFPAAAIEKERRPPPGRGGWGLLGAACNRLHLGRRPGPSLSMHLQTVRSRGERGAPQARGHAPTQVVPMCHHFQLGRSAQVRSHRWRPPYAVFPSHQQCVGYQDPHRRRRRAQRPVRRRI